LSPHFSVALEAQLVVTGRDLADIADRSTVRQLSQFEDRVPAGDGSSMPMT